MIAIIHLERGIPSKRKSSACVDYSLPLVHTARRYYRLDDPVKSLDRDEILGVT